MRVPGFALIHRARVVQTSREGARDEQGERVPVPDYGPWFPCRRTTRRPSGKSQPDPGGRRQGTRPWLLIFGDEDENGDPLQPPTASQEVEVEITQDDGRTLSIRYAIDAVPASYDAGGGPFGGQAELVEVVPAS